MKKWVEPILKIIAILAIVLSGMFWRRGLPLVSGFVMLAVGLYTFFFPKRIQKKMIESWNYEKDSFWSKISRVESLKKPSYLLEVRAVDLIAIAMGILLLWAFFASYTEG